jgi:hypothetical protein
VILEAGDDLLGREQLDACGGELDRQRHPVQPCRDPGDRRGIGVGQLEARPHRPGPGREELG